MTHPATIADVAREAGVSQQTVSRALNNKPEISAETRARILAVVARLGYRPSTIARGLVTRRTMTIGLVVPDITNPFFSEVALGAEDAAQEAGYGLLLGNTAEDPAREERLLRTLEARRVDGMILCSPRQSEDRILALAARYPAVVLINRCMPGSGMRTVRIDDEAGAIAGVRHLLSTGRRVIGFLAGPAASYSAQRRAAGYRRALSDAGLPIVPGLIMPCEPFIESGREAAGKLLAGRPDIDGLYCYNDLAAVGALQACEAVGRHVPKDVAVLGVDDIMVAALVTPPLTTIRAEKRQLGAMAVRSLLEHIGGCVDCCMDVVLQPRLVIRKSA